MRAIATGRSGGFDSFGAVARKIATNTDVEIDAFAAALRAEIASPTAVEAVR